MPTSRNVGWEVYQCPVTKKFLDPFRVLAGLHHYAANKFNELVKDQSNPTTALKLAVVGRKVMELEPVDPQTGAGFPDAVVLNAVEKFVEYVKGKGSGAGSWRNYASPLEPSQPASAPTSCSPCGSHATGWSPVVKR